MGQHQGFDLLVYRLDSICRARFGKTLGEEFSIKIRRRRVFDYFNLFGRVGCLARNVETNKLECIQQRLSSNRRRNQTKNRAERFVSKRADV